MNETNKKIKDHSRFTRWVNGLDEKDKNLSTLERKSKWVLILVLVFVLFALSFIVVPRAKVYRRSLAGPITEVPASLKQSAGISAFELPVDSFENHLKLIIYEGTTKKE